MDEKQKLGERIRILRGERSQKVFADQIGVTDVAMSKIECGIFYPRIATLVAICNFCHVSADYLIFGK